MNTATIHVTPDPDTDADDVVVGIEDAAYAEIALAAIHPDPDNQTRPVDAAFVASIKTHGVLQPVLVCPRDTGDGYDLVAGERRWTAASRAGLATIPAVIRHLTPGQKIVAQACENLHRSDVRVTHTERSRPAGR